MAYCPACTASYSDDDYLCPDCRVSLVHEPRRPEPGERGAASRGFVELYRCYNEIEANLLAGHLVSRGIPARVRSLSLAPPSYPITIGSFAEQRILVDADCVGAARRVIVQAVADGFISSDGAWLPV